HAPNGYAARSRRRAILSALRVPNQVLPPDGATAADATQAQPRRTLAARSRPKPRHRTCFIFSQPFLSAYTPPFGGYFAMRGGAGRPCRRAFTSFYREMHEQNGNNSNDYALPIHAHSWGRCHWRGPR